SSAAAATKPKALEQQAGSRARRWVVERTHSWLNRCRALLIRWLKKPENHLALLHLACALITWKAVTAAPLPGEALSRRGSQPAGDRPTRALTAPSFGGAKVRPCGRGGAVSPTRSVGRMIEATKLTKNYGEKRAV